MVSKQLMACVLIALLAVVLGALGSEPALANPLGGIASVSAGGHNACALTTMGGVKCWGDNGAGQLGDGTNVGPESCGGIESCSTTPVEVTGLASGVTTISMGNLHACALTTAAGIKCWGYNTDGELGDGTQAWRFAPVNVTGLTSGVAAVSAGGYHTCALTTAGGVKCWGDNAYGQLGDGTTTDSSTPVDVSGLTAGAAAVSAGYLHTCAVTSSGAVKCWGLNEQGQLGTGTNSGPETCLTFACSTTPVDASGLTSDVAAVALGNDHTCALMVSGGVKCWGDNGAGQLGDGWLCGFQCSIPVDVTGLISGVAAVSAGGAHTCALTTEGGVKCWGANVFGQLGTGTSTGPQSCAGGPCSTVPVDVSGLTGGIASVAAGQAHTCILTIEGNVKCWGLNDSGELGAGTATGPEVCHDTHYCGTVPLDVVAAVKVLSTPTPPSVGGISFDPRSGAPSASHPSAALPLAAVALVGVGAAVGAAWYTQRRRLRRHP